MQCHKKMYAILCYGISEALDALPYCAENLHAILLLERALREAEEVYIQEAAPKISDSFEKESS